LIEIRPARPRDLDALVALSLAVARARKDWAGINWSPSAVAAERRLWWNRLKDDHAWVGVAVAGVSRVGCTAVWASRGGSDPRLAYLVGPLVDPDWWGEGIGTTLYDTALDALAGRGFRRVEMAVEAGNRPARDFLERRGWERAELLPARSPMALVAYVHTLGSPRSQAAA
jgi:GNAT superfamily N-acetyltransferase